MLKQLSYSIESSQVRSIETSTEALTQGGSSQSLEGLIGHVPDLERDRVALGRAASGAPAVSVLAERLHSDPSWRQSPLGDLLPGLDSIGAHRGPFPPPIGARAANCLLRAQVIGWDVLAGWTPADLSDLDGVGQTSLEEILRVAVREWAAFHIEDSPALDPSEIYDGLSALSAWGASTKGTRGAVAAIAAAAGTDEQLPPRVARAMRALRRIDGSEDESRLSLERAFLDLEAAPGFTVFKRRQLESPAKRPTLTELADELGVSRSRPGQMEASIERRLARLMREPDWPVRLAAEELRERLGSVARRHELDDAFASLDPGRSLESGAHAHRRALLLWLCAYRVGEEWVLGPDIESITDVILTAVANGEQADLDAVSRHLALLGVREEVRLGWILSRSGIRIIDNQIVPSG